MESKKSTKSPPKLKVWTYAFVILIFTFVAQLQGVGLADATLVPTAATQALYTVSSAKLIARNEGPSTSFVTRSAVEAPSTVVIRKSPSYTNTVILLENPTTTNTGNEGQGVSTVNFGMNLAGSTVVAEVNGHPISTSALIAIAGVSDVIFNVGGPIAPVATSTTTAIVNSTPSSTSTTTSTSAHSVPSAMKPQRTPLNGHAIFQLVSLSALVMLSAAFASRVKTIWPHRESLFDQRWTLRWLSLLIPLFGIFFVVSSTMLLGIWDVTSEDKCHSAILICLVFYVGQKVFEYMFLVERAHIIRMMGHSKNIWWWIEMGVVVLGFGIIAVYAFKFPVTGISGLDGLCRIGLPFKVTIPLLAFDICLNFALTLQFCSLAWTHVHPRSWRDIFAYIYSSLPFRVLPENLSPTDKVKLQIGRGTIGLFAIIMPTIANLVILFNVHGREQGWLCYTICTCDITWGAMIIHWMTSDANQDRNANQDRDGNQNRDGNQDRNSYQNRSVSHPEHV